MKRILLLMTCAVLAGGISPLPAQPWMNGLPGAPGARNFYDIQRAFREYWRDKDSTQRGKGWKQFKRWEWFWEQRVYPDGRFPDPMQLYNEYSKVAAVRGKAKGPHSASWTAMGPYTSPGGYAGLGRLNCVRVDPHNNEQIWVGSASGGLWHSTDAGLSWVTSTDELPTLGVTDILIDPTNTNTMYIATGDGDAGDTYSIGVLKSTDGGASWNTTGLNWSTAQTRTISRLLMHPNDVQTLFAAGDGVYKSTDGGATWSQVLFGEFRDMRFKPGAPDTMYVSGNSNDVQRTTNGGATWASSSGGISGAIGRIALGVSPGNPEYVYALAANNSNSGFAGLFRSTNSGTSWTLMSNSPNLLGWSPVGSDVGGQGWYDLAVAVSPSNANEVYVGGVNNWKSTDGGSTWHIITMWYTSGSIPTAHADQHDLWFDPATETLYAGNDGGIYVSFDGGASWSWLGSGLQTTQFYRLGLSATDPSVLIAGSQDNGTKSLNAGGWRDVLGGDGMEALVDYSDANIMYGSLYYGAIYKSVNGGYSFTPITENFSESGAWVTPYVIHPSDPQTLFAGFSNVWKTTNRGGSWDRVGQLSGGTLAILDVAPSDPNVIYAGRSGSLMKTTDGGLSGWSAIPSPPGAGSLTYLAVHPSNPNTIWVTSSGYSAGNKVFYSSNSGATWTNISGTLPNVPVNCVVYQNNSPGRIYVGTDIGVYYRDDLTGSWQDFNTGLPNVVVTELEIQYGTRKLRASTYGRGIWESDMLVDQGIVIGPSPTALSFGSHETGTAVDTSTLTLSSFGTDSLTITGISNYTTSFVIASQPSLPVTLGPMQFVSLRVVFFPQVHGELTDSIVVTSNAQNGPTTVIRLSGKGVLIGQAVPGVLYAASGAPSGQLYAVNTTTGTATPFGPLGIPELQGLAVRPGSHELYGVVTTASRTTVYRVSSAHGDALPVTTLPVGPMRTVAFSAGDTLFGGATNGKLYRLDLSTGDTTYIGTASGVVYSGLSFQPMTGELWASVRPAVVNRDRIYKVNTSTGAATVVGNTGDGLITPSISFSAEGTLYGLKSSPQNSTLITIDTATGAGTTVGLTGVPGLLALAMRTDTVVSSVLGGDGQPLPSGYTLSQNYPNPFNPATQIDYALPVSSNVRISVFNLVGQNIATLVSGEQPAGNHRVVWNAITSSGFPAASGLYFYTIRATPLHETGGREFFATKKMLLLR